MSVTRANGVFIERMALRDELVTCGDKTEITPENQTFLDSSVDYLEGSEVSTISISFEDVYTITVVGHGFSDGDTVTLKNISGVPELSGTTWIIGNATADTFELITEVV